MYTNVSIYLLYLRVARAELLLVVGLADALAAAALGRLEHDRVADAVGRLDGLYRGTGESDISEHYKHTAPRLIIGGGLS